MFRVKADFKVVSTKLKDLKKFNQQIRKLDTLASKMRKVVVDDNRKFALLGIDKYERDYAELRPSTIRTRRGSGPPLAPRNGTSRVIRRFYCDYTTSNGQITLNAGWRGADVEWMKYHFSGYRHRSGYRVPARSANGIRPSTMRALKQLAENHFNGLAKNTLRTTPNNGVA